MRESRDMRGERRIGLMVPCDERRECVSPMVSHQQLTIANHNNQWSWPNQIRQESF